MKLNFALMEHIMRHFLLAVGLASLVSLGISNVSFAQASPTTAEQVAATCSVEGNNDACLAAVRQYVAKIKASGLSLDAKREDLNTLVTVLSKLGTTNGPDVSNNLVASAIEQVADDAGDIVDAETVAAVADNVRSGEPENTTAALSDNASPA